MTGQKKKYKTSKIKSFLFFLLLALVFWVLTKFSEESTSVVKANLVYSNLPVAVSIDLSTAKEIEFDMSANGFEFLSYNLKMPQIDIDIAKYYSEGDSILTISGSELEKLIMDQIGNGSRISNMSMNSLLVPLDILTSKKVAVRFVSEIDYKEGFKLVGEPILQPDSVLISGPSSTIEGMVRIDSENFIANNLSENIETTLSLSFDKNAGVHLSEETINVNLVVEEFAQKRVTLAVEVINVPSDIKLKLLPENIVISFDVSVNEFNSISENDFRIVCDYALRSSGENILVPKLVDQPAGLHHIEWSIRKVEYLIFK